MNKQNDTAGKLLADFYWKYLSGSMGRVKITY